MPAVTQIAHTAIRMQFIQQIQINDFPKQENNSQQATLK